MYWFINSSVRNVFLNLNTVVDSDASMVFPSFYLQINLFYEIALQKNPFAPS